MANTPFNPLDKFNLGESVAVELLHQPVVPLPNPRVRNPDKFFGAGIYAIYYLGQVSPFPVYDPIAKLNRNGLYEQPIYVGRAVPRGARKGDLGLVDVTLETTLFDRVRDHASSIDQAGNLSLEDFQCRYLSVEDIWISLGEVSLIAQTRPIWNLLIDGFGNHDPGSRRYDQNPSNWDTLHPGRSWASRLRGTPPDRDVLIDRIARFLRGEDVQALTPMESAILEETNEEE